MEIGYAAMTDMEFLSRHDRHIRPRELEASVRRGGVLLARENQTPLGWLRWGLFWDDLPFMNLLFVLEPHRGHGCGTALVAAWERTLRGQGYSMALTSTRSDEAAQHFYLKLGYADCGALLLPAEPLEIVLAKRLSGGVGQSKNAFVSDQQFSF